MIKLIILLIIIAIILVIYYYKITGEINSMNLDIEVGSIDFSKFNLGDYTSSGSIINSNINVYATNKGNLDLKFNSLVFSLYYQGSLIATTSGKKSNSDTMVIKANSTTVLTQEFNLYMNSGLISLIDCAKSNGNCQIDYSANVKWYFFKVPTLTGKFGTK